MAQRQGGGWHLHGYRKPTQDDFRAAIELGCELVSTSNLSRPATAGFVRSRLLHKGLSFREVQAAAPAIFCALSDGRLGTEITASNPVFTPDLIQAVALYAVELAQAQELPNSDADDRFRCQLPRTDRQIFDSFLVYLNAGSPGALITVERMVTKWSRFVTEVESGRPDSVDEYANDIWLRDALEDLYTLLSPAGRRGLASELESVDGRFDAATRPVSDSFWPAVRGWEPQRWWYYRVPRQLSAQFEQDLRGRLGLSDTDADPGLAES